MTDMNNEIGKTYQRPWGTYQTLALTDGYQVKIITVNPGAQLSLQKHSQRSEHWVVVRGQPTLTVGQHTRVYLPNENLYIPKEAQHRMENFSPEPCILVEVQVGNYLGEDDIVRIEDVYERV